MMPAPVLQLCLPALGAPAAWSLHLTSNEANEMVLAALSRQDQQTVQRLLTETVKAVAFSLESLPQLISDLEEAGESVGLEEKCAWEAWYVCDNQAQHEAARACLPWLLQAGRQLWGDRHVLRQLDVPGALYVARRNASVTSCILRLLPPVPVSFIVECAKRSIPVLDIANRLQVLPIHNSSSSTMTPAEAAAADGGGSGDGDLPPLGQQLLRMMLQPAQPVAGVVGAVLQQVAAGTARLSADDMHDLCAVAVTMPAGAAGELVEGYCQQPCALRWSPSQLQQLLLVALRLAAGPGVVLPLLQLPQARQLPWAGIQQLVRAAARHGGMQYILPLLPEQQPWPAAELLPMALAAIGTEAQLEQAVLTAPAAAEWGPEEVLQLVGRAAQHRYSSPALLDLVARQLPTAGVPLQQLQPIVDAACTASNIELLQRLLSLPAVQAAPQQVVAGFLMSTLPAESVEVVALLVALPALQQCSLSGVLQLIHEGLMAVWQVSGDATSAVPAAALLQLPGAQQAVELADAAAVMQQLVMLLHEAVVLEVPWAGQLLWLPAAQQLSPQDVGGLLLGALKRRPFQHELGAPPGGFDLNGYLTHLARLPGAQGISPLLLGLVLETALQLRYGYDILKPPPHNVRQCCCDVMAEGTCAVGALLQLPAARELPCYLEEGVLLIGEYVLRPKPPCCTRYLRQQLGVPPDQPPVVPGGPLPQ